MSVVLTVNGTDKTSSVVFTSLRKEENLNQQVDTLAFQVRKYGSVTYVPALGDEVVLTKGGTTIFGGVVVRITEALQSAKILEYSITCNDYSQYLKRELVTSRYTDQTIAEIIDDLITNYTTDGFTQAGVVGDLTLASISFNRLSVADCLEKLAKATSYVWYVDYDMDLHFFPKNTELGSNLTDSTANYIYESLEIVEDISQLKNAVLVQGGEQVSASTRTEYFDGDGTKVQFALANKYDHTPTVNVGGVAKTVGVDFLDDDASFDLMWNYNQKYIRFTAGHTPAAGTRNIDVTGTYLYPIVVNVPDNPSIATYGRYEFAITDVSIRTQDEAIRRATAELQGYKNELYEGNFRTYTDGFRCGQVININSTQRGKDIDVLIQSVTGTMRDPLGTTFEYNVRFATLKSIGIIEYLQDQLRSKEVIVDDAETLVNFYLLNTDEVGTSDSIGAPSHTSPPYVYQGSGGNTCTWGYGTWS